MRNPNTKCCICGKPLYRRPGELSRRRFVCCKGCFGEAERKFGDGFYLETLSLGRENGTNHLDGIPKSTESNVKRSISHKKYWQDHTEEAQLRGLKIRGENHGNWKGGITEIHDKIRTCSKYIAWASSVKESGNNTCSVCGSTEHIEAHHIVHFAKLLETYEIKSLDDALAVPEFWDIKNGTSLCIECHYKAHRRRFNDNRS